MNLSKHVTLAEFERSETAINRGINNSMNEWEIERAKLVCENCFEPIREHLAQPIKINSGFRSGALNRAIGGASTSQHSLGEAIDLDLHDRDLFEWVIDNVEFDQLIAEFPSGGKASWFHISYRKGRLRKQVLVGIKQKGKTVYLPWEQGKSYF
jgi:zinc D-Ala-D-Ala carboxypeptidase